MNSEKRGSEKLMDGCTGLTTLSQQELEQVAGGALSSLVLGTTATSYWKVFPHGIPWPEIFDQGALEQTLKLGDGQLRF